MQLNKKYLSYLVVITVIFFSSYQFKVPNQYKSNKKIVEKFDDTSFNSYLKVVDSNETYSKFWGITPKIVKTEELNTSIKLVEVSQKDSQNVLCISKSCYRLLGINYSLGKFSIILFNKDKKVKVKSYLIQDTLESSIYVDSINSNSATFKDLNSSREWQFKIFDVNQTKYKPKEIEL